MEGIIAMPDGGIIAQNIALIRNNILKAQAAPRAAGQVQLLAVTKTVDCLRIRQALACGVTVLGENRVQELLTKYTEVFDARWHLIGHLQTNKVKYIIDKAAMIQSLDSWHLAEEIQKRAAACGRVMPVLAQVNIADDDNKFGLSAAETESFLRQVAGLPNLKVEGLMTIGPYCQNAEEIRPVFAEMKALFDGLKRKEIPGIGLRRLSMGMSHDYAVAVEEGANLVRVGSAIFGSRST